jgi:hypothetical protein
MSHNAMRMLRAGVPVELVVYQGAVHGFNQAPEATLHNVQRNIGWTRWSVRFQVNLNDLFGGREPENLLLSCGQALSVDLLPRFMRIVR